MKVRCEDCRQAMTVRRATIEHPYHFLESGLPEIYLSGIKVYRCPGCGEESGVLPQIESLMTGIAQTLLSKPGMLAGPEVRYLRKHANWQAKELAGFLGMDPAYFSRVENGKVANLGDAADLLIRLLVREATMKVKHGREALDMFVSAIRNGQERAEAPLFRFTSKQEWHVAA